MRKNSSKKINMGILFVVFLALLVNSCSAKFPVENIEPCGFGDLTCIRERANTILLKHFNGIRKLGLLPLDPLKVDKMDIVQGGKSPVNIQLNFKNIDLFGFSKLVIDGVSGFDKKFDGQKMELKGFVPNIQLIGDYKIDGKILILPIQGNGKANITLSNTNAVIRFLAKSVIKNGEEYMQIEKLKLKLLTSRVYTYFGNLFNGDRLLGDNMNQFLNDNWQDIWPELRPIVEDAFAEVCKGILNLVFGQTPYSELFKQ